MQQILLLIFLIPYESLLKKTNFSFLPVHEMVDPIGRGCRPILGKYFFQEQVICGIMGNKKIMNYN